MNPSMSLYLDCWRVIACFLVFGQHWGIPSLTEGERWFTYGQDGVIIFFVLSGYVIAFVADTKEGEIREYSLKRLARLYSVLLPALLFTVLLDFGNRSFHLGLTAAAHRLPWEMVEAGIAGLFLNESWFMSVEVGTNGVVWSLAYEFWYYVYFALLFLGSLKHRVWLFLGAVLISGHKILLAFPIWLAGSAAYRLGKRFDNRKCSTFLTFGSLALCIGFLLFPFEDWFSVRSIWIFPLDHSMGFVGDTIGGIVFAGHLLAFSLWSRNRKAPDKKWIWVRAIRSSAHSTFAVYLLHLPVFFFIAAFVPYDHGSVLQTTALAAAIYLSIHAVGLHLEKLKTPCYRILNGLIPTWGTKKAAA